MRLRLAAVAPLALAVLACSPAGAGAAAGDKAASSRTLLRIELEGTNDYSISIVSNRRQRVTVLVAKEEVEGAPSLATEYLTRDTQPSPDRVKAKLPGLGSIAVSFHPRGRVRHPSPPGCEGPLPTVRPAWSAARSGSSARTITPGSRRTERRRKSKNRRTGAAAPAPTSKWNAYAAAQNGPATSRPTSSGPISSPGNTSPVYSREGLPGCSPRAHRRLAAPAVHRHRHVLPYPRIRLRLEGRPRDSVPRCRPRTPDWARLRAGLLPAGSGLHPPARQVGQRRPTGPDVAAGRAMRAGPGRRCGSSTAPYPGGAAG